MDEKEFWKIIDYAFYSSEGDRRRQAQIISGKLSEYTPEEIIDFELIFRRKVIIANDYKIMAAEKIIEGSVTDDPYLYFRCWLIGQGQMTFEQTLKNPDYLANIVEKGTETDFEDLLYVSTGAYKSRTGKKEEDENFPRDAAYKAGLDYDFEAPATTGKDWKEKELPTLYPKLWNKFN